MVVYLVTNTLNGKGYVGITSKAVARRWTNHKADALSGKQTALHRAIGKYGVDAFTVSVLASGLSPEGLVISEIQIIKQLRTRVPHGYNMTQGGDGTPGLTHTPEARAKIGAGAKGRIFSAERNRKLSDARKGKPLSLEHRAKLAASKLGKRLPKRSAIHCLRISDGLRRAHAKRKASQLALLQ